MKTIAELAAGVRARRPAAVARAISLVEDRRPNRHEEIVGLLEALKHPTASESVRVGITGPPGVGKSTLVARYVEWLRGQRRAVGVLAVDPSSPRSGGALLGDRARIRVDPEDADVFVRSMASGGQLGGLARSAHSAVEVMDAAFDVVVIETTGVGQTETDIETIADVVVLVIQPGSGDVLQFLKAGILEIPDLIVVNKADLGGLADRAAQDLRAATRALDSAHVGGAGAVLKVSAMSGEGLEEMGRRIDTLVTQSPAGTRQRRSTAWALGQFRRRFGEDGIHRAGGSAQVSLEIGRQIGAGLSPVAAVQACADARLGNVG